jgi:hypothetical protein
MIRCVSFVAACVALARNATDANAQPNRRMFPSPVRHKKAAGTHTACRRLKLNPFAGP